MKSPIKQHALAVTRKWNIVSDILFETRCQLSYFFEENIRYVSSSSPDNVISEAKNWTNILKVTRQLVDWNTEQLMAPIRHSKDVDGNIRPLLIISIFRFMPDVVIHIAFFIFFFLYPYSFNGGGRLMRTGRKNVFF